MECPYCNSKNNSLHHEVTLGLGKRGMHKCTSCEGCWLPVPFNAIEIEDHYKKSYFSGSVKEVYKGKVLSKDYISKVERIYPIKRGARILEVGAGFGFFANYASIKYSAFVDVLEPNEKSKQYIKRKHPGVNVIGSTLNDLDPLNKYDIIFCFHVLEHVTDIKSFLYQASLHLNESGKIFCLTPNSLSKTFKQYGTKWGWIGCDQHYAFLPANVPDAFFDSIGLHVEIKTGLVPAALHFPSVWRIKAPQIFEKHLSIRSIPYKNNRFLYKIYRKITHIPNFLIGKFVKFIEPLLAADSKNAMLLHIEAIFAKSTDPKFRDELCLVLSARK
jgi:SAM-dependent methyltransferase